MSMTVETAVEATMVRIAALIAALGAFCSGLAAVITAKKAVKTITEVKVSIDGRMDQLLEVTKHAAEARGNLQGVMEEKARDK